MKTRRADVSAGDRLDPATGEMRERERGGACAAVGSTRKESQLHALNTSLIEPFAVNYILCFFGGCPAALHRAALRSGPPRRL
ncbi:hypothetical protein Acsp04_57000 [Actinomadura sp. NBRC 104425]|nr:hypothetical protein Acsp04_57000 [Actinomadura sp. NBRC 104425]